MADNRDEDLTDASTGSVAALLIVPRRYIEVLRLPGVGKPAAGAAIASLPIGMLGLAVLLLVSQSESGYAAAGAVVGLLGLGTGLGMVLQGRLIDRWGQPRVLIPATALQLIALIGLVVAANGAAGFWLLGLLAFLTGVGEPQVGASLRALWPVLAPPEKKHTAVALSSALFEGPVVLGPLLLMGLLAVSSPSVAVLAAGTCFSAGTWLLVASAASRAWCAPARERRSLLGPLVSPGVRTIVAVAVAQGLITALVQVPAAAAAAQYGEPGRAGLLYSALSAGSLVGTLAYGARRWSGRAAHRLAVLLMLVAAAAVFAAQASSLVVLTAALFAVGLGIGPVAVGCFALLEMLAPSGMVVEAFTTATAAGLTAFAVGTALAGGLVDRAEAGVGFLTAMACALIAVVIVIARQRTLRPSQE